MVPAFLIDLSRIDLNRTIYDAAAIEAVNPHRGVMRLLDGVVHTDEQALEAVAYKDVREDEFWVPGHIPGRPIFPGVLMIEAAAQLASFMALRMFPDIRFMGFAGVDAVKFRGQVTPGDRFYVLGKGIDFRRRRFVCAAQGMVNGTMVFEGKVTGMPL